METEMSIDGKKTGVKLDLDLNYVFKTVIVAAILWFGGVQWSGVQQQNEIFGEIKLMKYQLEEYQKQTANYVTVTDANNRGKLRDLQFSAIETRMNTIEAKVNNLDNGQKTSIHGMAVPKGIAE